MTLFEKAMNLILKNMQSDFLKYNKIYLKYPS